MLVFDPRSSVPLQRLKNSYVALAMRGFFKLEYELNLESKFPTLSRGKGIDFAGTPFFHVRCTEPKHYSGLYKLKASGRCICTVDLKGGTIPVKPLTLISVIPFFI